MFSSISLSYWRGESALNNYICDYHNPIEGRVCFSKPEQLFLLKCIIIRKIHLNKNKKNKITFWKYIVIIMQYWYMFDSFFLCRIFFFFYLVEFFFACILLILELLLSLTIAGFFFHNFDLYMKSIMCFEFCFISRLVIFFFIIVNTRNLRCTIKTDNITAHILCVCYFHII